jgi:hypothetical protein
MLVASGGMLSLRAAALHALFLDFEIGFDAWFGSLSSNARPGPEAQGQEDRGDVGRHARRSPLPHAGRAGSVPRDCAGDLGAHLSGAAARLGSARQADFFAGDARARRRGSRAPGCSTSPASRSPISIARSSAIRDLRHVGHDPAFNDLSPGAVLQLEAMRDCSPRPLRRFDFTEGEGQHKRQFATGGVACVDLLLLRPTPGQPPDDGGAGRVQRERGAGQARGARRWARWPGAKRPAAAGRLKPLPFRGGVGGGAASRLTETLA